MNNNNNMVALRGDHLLKFDQMVKSKGLGDTIEKITTATGIKKFVHKTIGNDCGCNKRKNTLNKVFHYKNKK